MHVGVLFANCGSECQLDLPVGGECYKFLIFVIYTPDSIMNSEEGSYVYYRNWKRQ